MSHVHTSGAGMRCLAGAAIISLVGAAQCGTRGDASPGGPPPGNALANDAGQRKAAVDAGFAITPPLLPAAVFAGLKTGADAQADLCANTDPVHHPNFPNDADLFIQVFCVANPPTPHSLVELEELLGLGFRDPNGENGAGGNPAFAILGHSSSLVARFVSAINPRAILFTPPSPAGSTPSGYVLLAFSRGDSFAEVIAHDPAADTLVLYLVRFQNACTGAGGGCLPADLLLEDAEKNWQSLTSYEATALVDTILDCHECHQPDYNNGYGSVILRMQEASPPYTHFFSSSTEGGNALVADFHAAHGTTEDYAGIPASMIDKSDPALLQRLIQQAGFSQPNAFDSAVIEDEVQASAPSQPRVNWPMGASATWSTINAQARMGNQIAVPYHDVKVTDASKLSAATALYRSVQLGQMPTSALTDIRDVFLDPGARDMGFAPAAGSSGQDLFVQVCEQCHNSRLNPQVSRGNFNVELLVSGQLRPAEKQVAVGRLSITDSADPAMMPPPLLRTLTAGERQSMIDFLQ